MKFGILKERKNPPDRRVVFSPEKLQEFTRKFPVAEVKIESSDIRVFDDESYRKAGFEVSKNMTDCDILIGVKEVPIAALIPYKKYFFFSHTIKEQPYNRALLQAVLKNNIELYDHETLVDKNNNRLIGFGYYAGVVGAYNGFRAFGLKYDAFYLPKATQLTNQQALIDTLKKIPLPNIKIVLTGSGRVAHGARTILEGMKIQQVTVEEYINKNFDTPVYCMIDVLDYNKRTDGQRLDIYDFFNHHKCYQSDFMRFAKVSDFFIAGHFYAAGAPYLFTREDAKSANFRIKVVADISCDIDGPVASTIRPATIADPIYGYNPQTGKEVDFKDENAIAVMAVDNLPCELPRDASEGFGELFLKNVISAFYNDDKDGILSRAKVTENGKLTQRFCYLQDYVEGV